MKNLFLTALLVFVLFSCKQEERNEVNIEVKESVKRSGYYFVLLSVLEFHKYNTSVNVKYLTQVKRIDDCDEECENRIKKEIEERYHNSENGIIHDGSIEGSYFVLFDDLRRTELEREKYITIDDAIEFE